MRSTIRSAALGAALAALCAYPASGVAQRSGDDPSDVTPEQASQALAAAEQALAPDPGAPDRDATAALSALADALPALEGQERREAEAILARPTDSKDPFGDSYGVPAAHVDALASPSGQFCIWYVDAPGPNADKPPPADADLDLVPDYVEEIADIADLVYGVEVGSLDWEPPKNDRNLAKDDCGPPPSSTSDIYLKELGELGLFGYEASDPGETGRSRSGYLVIDNDYKPSQFPGYADAFDAARVTLAHEFNHLLQERYDAVQDLWMFETTAVWMEEKVFPAIDDYLNYVGRFASTPGAPLTDPRGAGGLRIYGAAVWQHWLERGGGYGPEVVRRAWEVSTRTRPPDFGVAAFDRAIENHGGRGYSREFARFAAATAEWRSGAGGFPDASRYPEVKRNGVLKPRKRAKRFRIDHSAYRLFQVKRVRAKRIRLVVRAERKVRAGLAIVARRGDKLDGTVKRKAKFLRKGGRGVVNLRKPRRFKRITAVVVNADGRQKGFSPPLGDWVYRKDRARFAARLKR